MTFHKADINRAIKAVKAADCSVSGVRFYTDGSFEVLIGDPAKAPVGGLDPTSVAAVEITSGGSVRVLASPPKLTQQEELDLEWKEFQRDSELRQAKERKSLEAAFKNAARRLDRDALARAYEGFEFRSAQLLERVIAINRYDLDAAQRYGMIEARKGGGRAVYSMAAVLKSLGVK